MAIQVKDVYLTTRTTFQLSLIAGENGLSNYFIWPHVLENIMAINFLHGHELIITTGIGSNSPDWLKSYITGLINKETSGLIINVGPFLGEISQDIIDLCNRNNFPLFTVPWHIHLCDIIMEYCNRIIANDKTNINNAEAIKNAIFYPNTPDLYRVPLVRNNFKLEDTFSVIIIKTLCLSDTIKAANITENILLMLKMQLHSAYPLHCIFQLEDTFVITINQLTQSQLEQLVPVLSEKISVTYFNYRHSIGASTVKNSISSMPLLYEQASSALKLSQKQELPYILFHTSPVNKLLLSVSTDGILSEVHREILGTLIDYDKEHDTDYLDTLRLYLENDSSVQVIADLKYAHRNTINYRIRKIKDLLGNDLSSPETKFLLQLAFHIQDVL